MNRFIEGKHYRVMPSGCWEWMRSKSDRGYGTLGIRGIYWSAHRYAYTLIHGTIPEGHCVCHSCDNKLCVNPDHLWLGTQADNVHDAIQKQRHHFVTFLESPMPYIKQADRTAFDPHIKALSEKLTTAGELNYIITRLVASSLRTVSYESINAAIGVLEAAKLELYRRLAGPYEDTKVATNGDVPEYRG
jgi:hypothetical protein